MGGGHSGEMTLRGKTKTAERGMGERNDPRRI